MSTDLSYVIAMPSDCYLQSRLGIQNGTEIASFHGAFITLKSPNHTRILYIDPYHGIIAGVHYFNTPFKALQGMYTHGNY
jgi:hypothetical protein